MYRFEHIEFLYLLLAIPLLVLAYAFYSRWKKSRLKTFADSAFLSQLLPQRSVGKPLTKFLILLLAYTLLVVALANPQIGSKLEEVKREGVDIMIALDLSNSMLAEDLSPNRLERSRRAISKLIDELKNDRIGIVVFAGQAYTQLPITTDYAAAKLFLSTINTDIIPTQGTAIGAAIELAAEAFDYETPTSKTIIVITDGENHEDNAVEAAKEAAQKGVVVHTIGMGSERGAPLPIYRGKQRVGFRKDKDGSSIVSRLNADMLAQIATAGGGEYVRATNSQSGLDYILDRINKLEKAEFGSKVFSDYEDRFQYFLAAALLLLLVETFMLDRKNKWLNSEKLFGTSK